ncbi:DUF4268 domain-containing protein [Haloarchaeobius iranensis]|uniref:DUF4268 domain-containing protein n=1 Tax=Haloarchaeobius iranensis TaxID=996166 RepID=A0A1H0B3R8_9EURY|nr:DUF4268 domain-containing protein [Haloarchaeobius iranensis]SDN40242.1 protein of unknown function [Haloarchaeobius iranensis]
MTASNPEFDSLTRQDVREYWEHEEQDFTPWLARAIEGDDPSELEDALGLDLEVLEREKRVGKYSVDIYARVVDDGRKVVIENQLNTSDHDHLGKAIAYAAGVDADIIVWIAPQFNDEHTDAFQWLNSSSREGINLFAVRLEVWKISDSEPAVRLNPVEEPSAWKEMAKRTDEELSETKTLQEQFWTAFANRIEETGSQLSARKPRPQHWYNNPIGRGGFALKFTLNSVENRLACGLLIRDNADAYRELESQRDEIDPRFEEDLEWVEPETTRAGKERSQIIVTRDADLKKEDEWDTYLAWLLEQGERFHDVFHDRVRTL